MARSRLGGAARADDRDRAPVGEVGNGELSDTLERGAIVDQLGERLVDRRRNRGRPRVCACDTARQVALVDERPLKRPSASITTRRMEPSLARNPPPRCGLLRRARPDRGSPRSAPVHVEARDLGANQTDSSSPSISSSARLPRRMTPSGPIQGRHHRSAEEVVELGFAAADLGLYPLVPDQVCDLGGEGGDVSASS